MVDFSIRYDKIAMNYKGMTKRRIFIALNLPDKMKKKLGQFKEKYDYLPVRWTKDDCLHLTLVFIGYVTDEQMLETCKTVRKVAAEFLPFFINFKRVILGPPGKPPRMIWVEGQKSPELSELKKKLEDALLSADSGLKRIGERTMTPHITLARIKNEQWRQLPERPGINEVFDYQISASSIEVMESELKRSGAEYTILESCELFGKEELGEGE